MGTTKVNSYDHLIDVSPVFERDTISNLKPYSKKGLRINPQLITNGCKYGSLFKEVKENE